MAKKTETGKTTTKTTAASKATKPAAKAGPEAAPKRVARPAAKRPVRAKATKPTLEPKETPVSPQAATSAPEAAPATGTTTTTSPMTCLDAAYAVLTRLDKPMRTKELMEQMVDRELWTSPGGSTPDATLTSAIIRDIAKRGERSRFKRVDRGYYAAREIQG